MRERKTLAQGVEAGLAFRSQDNAPFREMSAPASLSCRRRRKPRASRSRAWRGLPSGIQTPFLSRRWITHCWLSYLAPRPALMTAALVGMVRVLADHIDADRHATPGASLGDRQAPRWCLASVDHDQPLSGRLYHLAEADLVTRNAVSGWH